MIDLEGSLLEQRTAQRRNTTGGPMCKALPDLFRYGAILRDVAPDLLVETGTWTGASAQWFRKSGARHVVTIDTNPVELNYPGVTFLHGSSTDLNVAAEVGRVTAQLGAATVMVVLDSDHAAAHVFRELCLYAPLVSVGSYLVVEDTLTHWMPNTAGYEGSPWDAVEQWWEGCIPASQAWRRDAGLEDMLPTTQHPGGWLQRVR